MDADHPPTYDIAVLERKQRLGFGIGAENSFQRFECRGLTKPAGRAPFLQPALLIDPNFRRHSEITRPTGCCHGELEISR
jgi:hypothetical protein